MKKIYIVFILMLIISVSCSKNNVKISKVKNQPDKSLYYYKKGREHFLRFSRKDVKIAIGYFNMALKIKPTFYKAVAAKSEALSYLAFQKERNGNANNEEFRLAKEYALKALKNNRQNSLSYRALAWYFFTAGLYSFAEKSAHKALMLNPNDGEASFILWVVKDKKNMNSPYLKKSVNSGYIIALLNAGSVMRRKKRYYEAIKYFKKVIKKVPNHIHARVNIGNVYLLMNEYEKAQEYYKKALRISPSDSYIIFNYALSFVKMRRYKQALRYCRKAISINKKFIYPHLLLMRLYKRVYNNQGKYRIHKRIVSVLQREKAIRFQNRVREAKNIGL